MKQILSLFFFIIYMSYIFPEGDNFVALTPLSSVADIFIYRDHLQIKLKVHKNSLGKIVGVKFSGHELGFLDNQAIIVKLIKNNSKVVRSLERHLQVSTNSHILNLQYKKCSFENEGYISFDIRFSYFDNETIRSISLIYDYPKDPSGYDSLPLTVFDQREGKVSEKTVLLHGNRKKLIWTPSSLKTEMLSINTDYQFDFKFIILTVLAVFIIFLPSFRTFFRRKYND